jgi:DNA polymerase-3 subunit gamma/tau
MKSEYEALYNKYRPRTIDDLIGQEHIALTLRKAFEKNRLYQAYLFHGIRGSGKTTSARILAMGYNCEKGPTANPCGQCQACQDILNERCIDIVELDAASKTSVADIRELQQSIVTATSQVRVKFYIIDEVHRISPQAQDAFLKTLEEPPPHVVFVLCTTEMDKLKETIISRVLPLEFRRIKPEKIAERLEWITQQEKFTADKDALMAIAKTCEGGMRDAIVKLSAAMCVADTGHVGLDTINTIIGSTGSEQCVELVDAVIDKDAYKIFQIIGKVAEGTTNLHPFYMNIMNYFRSLMAISSHPEMAKLLDIPDARAKIVTSQAQKIGINRIVDMMKKIIGYSRMVDSVKGRMVLETMCLELTMEDNVRLVNAPVQTSSQAITGKTQQDTDVWLQIRQNIDPKIIKIIDNCKQKPKYENGSLFIYMDNMLPMEVMFVEKAKTAIQTEMNNSGIAGQVQVKSGNVQAQSSGVKTIQAKDVFGGA